MQIKRKKFWFTFVIVCVSIFVVFGAVIALTGLKDVSVEYVTTLPQGETRLKEDTLDNVKRTGDFDYKSSLLFMNVNKNIEAIEKNNPFIKVEKIVRKFPNKLCVYVSERIPKYRINETGNASKWFILDEDFKVLASVTNEKLILEEFDKKTIQIKYFTKNLFVGDFCDDIQNKNLLNTIMSGVYGKTKDYLVIDSIDYDSGLQTFTMAMRYNPQGVTYEDGCELQVIGLENLKNNVFKAVSVYYNGYDSQGSSVDFSKKIIIVSNDSNCIMKNQEE